MSLIVMFYMVETLLCVGWFEQVEKGSGDRPVCWLDGHVTQKACCYWERASGNKQSGLHANQAAVVPVSVLSSCPLFFMRICFLLMFLVFYFLRKCVYWIWQNKVNMKMHPSFSHYPDQDRLEPVPSRDILDRMTVIWTRTHTQNHMLQTI